MPPLLTPVTTREMPTLLTTMPTLLYSTHHHHPGHRWRVRSSRRPSSTVWPPRSRARRCDDSSCSKGVVAVDIAQGGVTMLALPTPLTLLTPLTPHHGPSLQSPMTTTTTPYTTGAHGRGPRGSRAPQDVRPGLRASRRQPAAVRRAAVRRAAVRRAARHLSAVERVAHGAARPMTRGSCRISLAAREHLTSRWHLARHGTSRGPA